MVTSQTPVRFVVDSGKFCLGGNMLRRVVRKSAAFVCFLVVAPLTFGQSTFGSFTGTVKDPSGAVIPSATVEVINEGTGNKREVSTSSAGVFNVPNLDLGAYKVRV